MITDEIDFWLVKSLLESKTGSTGYLYVPGENHNFFMDTVVHTPPTIHMRQERNFDVFCVEHGVPDLFTLTGFSQPIVCYHLGYIGKFIKFRNYIMEDPSTPRINQNGIANLFELLSALYLQSGKETFATMCLLQSIIETPSQALDKDVYDGTIYQLNSTFYNKRIINETGFTLLYYGLTHEMGHTYADDCIKFSIKAHSQETTDKAITESVVRTARNAFREMNDDSDYMFNRWYESYLIANREKGSVLHCENLRSEILADNLGFNILITSIGAFARHTKQKLNYKSIVSEAIISLFIVQLMEACKYIVKALPNEQLDIDLTSRYFPISVDDSSLHARLNTHQIVLDFQIAHAVRWEYLKPSLTSLVLMHLFPDTWTMKGNSLTISCSPLELKKREKLAITNIENYLSFYTPEMLKFQARLEDVIHFVTSMITGKVPEYKTKHSVDENFSGYILGNFEIYLNRLTGERGIDRKKEIYAQLIEYKTLLLHRGKKNDTQPIEKILHLLELELNSYLK